MECIKVGRGEEDEPIIISIIDESFQCNFLAGGRRRRREGEAEREGAKKDERGEEKEGDGGAKKMK